MTYKINEHQAETLLEILAQARVLSIERQKDGSFELVEGCDEFFSVTLTAEQIYQLGAELQSLGIDR